MFANLKNKIFEEVKASPQKFQQFAQAAQAAVSSTSSNASDSVSGSDNFFSITEEDTPQNSPHKTPAASNQRVNPPSVSLAKQSNPVVSFTNNGVSINRTRRLSNSSLASDVSFRLPSYDSPAIYHLQSDLDVSASEVEDSGSPSNIQLDIISKEQLYSAYKKSLERYQKYRSRFTDLAKRYRDLERDSTKARSVLVETQDKAIRRISELREQCSLEQQAKAHLEEALRLEMDDMQCKIKAYETKLKLLGENPEHVSHAVEPKSNTEESLIQLDSEDDNAANGSTIEKLHNDSTADRSIELLNEKIVKLEELVAKYKKQLSENSVKLQNVFKENENFKSKQEECDVLISNLKKREEENSILLAENKLMVHTELENKEGEVKRLKQKIGELERNSAQDQIIANLRHQMAEKEKLIENINKQRGEHDQKFIQVEKENKELRIVQARKIELEKELENIAKQLSELQILLEARKDMEEKVKRENDEFRVQITNLKKELNETKAESKANQVIITELKAELESNRIIAQTQESAVATALQNELKEMKNKSDARIKDLEVLITQKEEAYKKLEQEAATLKELGADLTEEAPLKQENLGLIEQIEKLKTDHTEREIQMEKEKMELQSQVTNILQEIDRMEEQMKEVRRSHDLLEEEKRGLEKKMEKMTKQNLASQEGQQKWQVLIQEAEDNIKQLETKLKTVETENTQLAEKNCLQEENLKRFELLMKENENTLKREKQSLEKIIKEAEASYSTLRSELETANETVRKLNEKMSEVLDENSRLHNAKEIMEHEFRSLQDQYESREKEKLCVLDNNKCLEEELQRVRRENDELRGGSGEDKKQLQRLLDEIKQTNDRKVHLEQEIEKINEEVSILRIKEKESDKVLQERNELRTQAHDLQVEIQNLMAIIKQETESKESATKELEQRIDALSKDNTTLREQSDKYFQEIAQLNTKNENRLEELQSLLKRANEEKNILKETIKNASDLEKKLHNYEEQKIENQYLNTSIHQLEVDIKNMKEEKAKCESEIVELKEKVKSQQCELYVCSEDKAKHESQLNILKEQLNKSGKETESLREILKSEREETIRQSEHCALITNENDKLKKDLLSWQQQIATAENSAKESRLKLEELSTENVSLKNELEKADIDFKENYIQLPKENEQLKKLISSLTEQLTLANEKLVKLEVMESSSQQLQTRIKELEVEISERVKAKNETILEATKHQQSEMETLRNLNERLQRELEELKHKTSSEILNLTHEIDDLTSSAKAMSEKLAEYESLKQKHKKLSDDLNSMKGDNGNEDTSNYEDIRKEKEDLESKLEKIMHEVQDVSNRNLFLEQKCENYLILEQSNERLKLANAKLSRQLDETLVSLQHHEGISANTEFEYLRNIMFQYLTGSVTRNNSTLVKVIAAVLKFTPQQTQVAIEKENHRHTLVGQISNLL